MTAVEPSGSSPFVQPTTARVVNEYRAAGERDIQGSGFIPWYGVWREGARPSKNEQYAAVKMIQDGQRNVRWEFRTVAYSEVYTVEVTADA